jgi:C-terminal processing protease CtpA/Prc
MGKFFTTSLLAVATLVNLVMPARADVLYGSVQYKNATGRIGVSVNKKGLIRLVHPDSPAEEAGLVPGDIVESVNGKLKDVWHIHGAPETYVTLMVRRGDSKFLVKVKRIDYHEIRRNNSTPTIAKSETA